jgi:uncharacterized protein YecE (DUF72 family)
MRIHIGTSGYNYPEWNGTFYPADIKSKDMFAYYRDRFHTVEINATFYRMPTPKTTEGWLAQATPGFIYALKAPRRITHDRRLKAETAEHVQFFINSALVLGDHLGPLLFQLPPNFKADVPRLEAFLASLPAPLRTAFEFRHESWHEPAVFDLLRAHGAALCVADVGDRTTPIEATARHGYVRLRDEGYDAPALERWIDDLAAHAGDWDDVYVFFKHEEAGRGAEFARDFSARLEARGLGRASPSR